MLINDCLSLIKIYLVKVYYIVYIYMCVYCDVIYLMKLNYILGATDKDIIPTTSDDPV